MIPSKIEVGKMSCRFCGERFILVHKNFITIECPNGHIEHLFYYHEDLVRATYYVLSSEIKLCHSYLRRSDDKNFAICFKDEDPYSDNIDIPYFDLDHLSLKQILAKVQMCINFS